MKKDLKWFRNQKSFTQQDVALKLNVSQARYASIEKGKVRLTKYLADKLANVFEVSTEELLSLDNITELKVIKEHQNDNRVAELEKEIQALKSEKEQLKKENNLLTELYSYSKKESEKTKGYLERIVLHNLYMMFHERRFLNIKNITTLEDFIEFYYFENKSRVIRMILEYNLFNYNTKDKSLCIKILSTTLKRKFIGDFYNISYNFHFYTLEDLKMYIEERYKESDMKNWVLSISEDIFDYFQQQKNDTQTH